MYQSDFRIDFIGIGAGKSGTTWLADMLRQHPGIYYPDARKEINYFNALLPQDYQTPNPEYLKGLDWYHHFFAGRKPGQKCGEITPSYLPSENAAADIYQYNRNIKIFAMLRHPAERSFSEYLFSVQNGISTYKSFEDALTRNPKKYLQPSLYCSNLKNFYTLFPQENIRLYFFEDLKNEKFKILEDICHFIGVDLFIPEHLETEINTGLQAKNQTINNFIGRSKMWMHRNNMHRTLALIEKTGLLDLVKKVKSKNLVQHSQKQAMTPQTRMQLCSYFIEDVKALEAITGKNLDHWKS